MYKIKIKKVVFPKSTMDYPDCLDLIFAHLLATRGEDYRALFSECMEIRFNLNGKDISEVLSFPMFDTGKYSTAGIKVEKVKVEKTEQAIAYMRSCLNRGNPAVVHLDGFDCPWDKACYHTRRNDHIVMVTGISKRGDKCIVCDPYFSKYNQRFSVDHLMESMRFYYEIQFPLKLKINFDHSPNEAIPRFIKTFGMFVETLNKRVELLEPETEFVYLTKLCRTLQAGRVNMYFYRIFLSSLEQTNDIRDWEYRLAEADCLWTNSILYLIRGIRTYYRPKEMLKHLQILNDYLNTKNEVAPQQKNRWGKHCDFQPIDISRYFNCKMFLKAEECEKSDFIEDEMLCIMPKKGLETIVCEGKQFAIKIDFRKDNIRCLGQVLECETICCGVSMLFVAEWIDATVTICFIFEDGNEQKTQIVVEDFPEKTLNAVEVGDAYDITRWRAFDHVYGRVLNIAFEKKERLIGIRLPSNSHVHLLSAVAVI